jgi:hypothetical protein
MAGYIGNKSSVTQVDGYTRAEADTAFIENGDVITVSGGNVGIGMSPAAQTKLHIREDDSVDYRSRMIVQASDHRTVVGAHWQGGVAQYSYIQATNNAESNPQKLILNPDGGVVTIPYQPAFSAQTEQFDGNGVGINYASAVPWAIMNGSYHRTINVGGHFNFSTGVFTVPVSGVYLVSIRGNNDTNAVERNIGHVWLNGGFIGEQVESYGPYDNSGRTFIIDLSTNDYLQFGNNTGLPYTSIGCSAYLLG